ncbi:energy transducer TonB [Rhodanobacter ginsengiterrae]|uniref:energy transducer TonB n=1 Tax=Rhodanobacter ginsengiterrae TaxID=2008451 RepID=UPI003CEC52AA
MKKALFAALLAMVTMVAQASSRENVESSTVVKGTIVLATDGTVQTAVVDDEASYGKAIADLVRKAALQWRFHPVLRDGAPVVAKSSMHVRVVLDRMPDGNYSARIKGATFGDDNGNSTDTLQAAEGNKKIMPRYPERAVHDRVQGTVYLSLHVDHDGHVLEAVAEQVNLGNLGPDGELRQYRKLLADAALKAARQWSYVAPTTGPLVTQNSWTVHIPVKFSLNMDRLSRTRSVWETYVPGPYVPAPWVDRPDTSAADALADGSMRTEGAGPTLLAPLKHG